jgi:hypothetical protein
MNKEKINALLEDGAYLNSELNQFHHASFRKGWRKMKESDISWMAIERMHGIFGTGRLLREDTIYSLAPATSNLSA